MRINWALRRIVFEKFRTQDELAWATGIDPSRISRIIRGYIRPNAGELKKLQGTLGPRAVVVLGRKKTVRKKLRTRAAARGRNSRNCPLPSALRNT
jgi:hypothetical protein